MHLQSLIINGFKSFPDAKLDFPRSGVTAVVGPNGVGKSNVVDAVLWVLGEQSTKALRTERMEDVIFNGTDSRKPLGMVEVSLVLGGIASHELDSLVAVGEDLHGSQEIMVTRRLFRDGESEYSINQIPCRLKDVRGLFLEARAGAKGHTVIEQGNIDMILTGSPQERRAFIEETAGIGRYRKQKTEALRKLQSTEQNLLRVRDILAEVRRQLRVLDRQAKHAQEYKALQEDVRELEIKILTQDYWKLSEQQRQVECELTDCVTRESGMLAEEARFMTEHEEIKQAQLAEGETLTHLQANLQQLEREMAQSLTAIEVQQNRIRLYEEQHSQVLGESTRLTEESSATQAALTELKERLLQADSGITECSDALAKLEEQSNVALERRRTAQEETDRLRQKNFEMALEKAQAENQRETLLSQIDACGRRLERLNVEQYELEKEHEQVGSKLHTVQQQNLEFEEQLRESQTSRETAVSAVQTLGDTIRHADQDNLSQQTARAGAESQLEALRAFIREEFGYSCEGNEEKMPLREACSGIREALVERLDVPEGLERAIEAVLGDKIRAWVIESPTQAVQAIAYLKHHELGRGTFVPPLKKVLEKQIRWWWPSFEGDGQVLGRALDLVQVPDELKDILTWFLGQAVVVKTLDGALDLFEQDRVPARNGPVLVTLDGELIDGFGVVSGGTTRQSGGVLQRQREVRQLEKHLENLTLSLEESRLRRESLSKDCQTAEGQIRAVDETIKETERQLIIAEQQKQDLKQTLLELEEKCHTISQEQVAEEREQSQMKDALKSFMQRLSHLEHEKREGEDQLSCLATTLHKLEEDCEALQSQVTEMHLRLTSLQERRTHEQRDLERLEQEQEAHQTRRLTLDQRLQELLRLSSLSQDDRVQQEVLLDELNSKKAVLEAEILVLQEHQTSRIKKVRDLEGHLGQFRENLLKSREIRGEKEVRSAEIRTKLAALEETLTSTYSLSIDEARARASHDAGNTVDAGEEAPQLAWREQLAQMRHRLERLGPINLAAIDEHQALEERYKFLTDQERDLTSSIRSLQEIISRLNQKTDRMFHETFDKLQQKFGEVFSALFAGGRAELLLINPEEDPESAERDAEPGIEIVAQPPGKRLKNLAMLSGGEKALTVLALLFASFLIKPSPFCILDEVDAPLDETNVARFARFLGQLANGSQFLIITHNKRTMEVADSLFGVTMEEPGVSKFVSVRLNDFQAA